MWDLAWTGSSGCRAHVSADILPTQFTLAEMIMEMAGGGGASTLVCWMRNNEELCSEDFTQLTHRLRFLLAA